jgi:phosphatidate cytidylyltransferase
MHSKLLMRIISALAGIAIISGAYFYLGKTGLIIFSLMVCTVAIFEAAKLVLPPQELISPRSHNLFVALSCLTLSASVFFHEIALAVVMLAILIVITGFLLLKGSNEEKLEELLRLEASAVLGLVYAAVLPSFVIKLLSYSNGEKWFFAYLGIVFAGDTFAYFGGKYFGNKKLMPSISPQKTVVGSVGGLIGSLTAAAIVHFMWFPDVSLPLLLSIALVTGIFAQIGDLFESLIKRVARVKDSGSVMPGHGGVLDRLDGIYFAAPLFFVAVHFLD